MLPAFKQFKVDYENISVGKGLPDLDAKFKFLEIVKDYLVLEGYSKSLAFTTAIGKAMGVETVMMFRILNSPIIKEFDSKNKIMSRQVKMEFITMIVDLIHRNSEKEAIDKMFSQ